MSDPDITDTAVAQPLIVAASLATAALLPNLSATTVFAGHSVGEYAACALAGAISQSDAVSLVAARGAAMAAAAASPASGMAAVLGGDANDVQRAITDSGCVVANVNAAGQVVAAGATASLDRLTSALPQRARLRRLAVAGAFHTDLMATARDSIAEAAGGIKVTQPSYGVLSNADGAMITNGAEALSRLVSQVCSPVRWDLCMRTLAALGVTATIELAPAGTLTALIRRELPLVATVALRGPDDLDAARMLVDEHSAELSDPMPAWQLLVAPTSGTVSSLQAPVDAELVAGSVVVRVTTRTEEVEVRAQQPGQLVEWLVHDGDPVSVGQPLARVSAEARA
jgi:[acyl-carrier-protein] S-malonyltransferase